EQDLLALASHPEVESRLIYTATEDRDYDLEHGPIPKETFKQLANSQHWTVLVQSVNLWHKQVATVLSHFNFIPNWRLDDIMLSYAADQGSVGPHVDAYDVFLIQTHGKRRWQVADSSTSYDSYVTECGLNLVTAFEPVLDVVLEPGDILYLPPNVAHHGISEGEGMTLSVGFRSPALSQLSMMLTEELLNTDSHYRDPNLANEMVRPGEISDVAMLTAQNWLKQHLLSDTIAIAFGKLQTQPKQDSVLEPLETEVIDYLQTGAVIHADPAGRLAWWLADTQVHFFANGEHQVFEKTMLPLITLLCSLQAIDLDSLSAYIGNNETKQILSFLDDVGYLGIESTHNG
ncbi:MAG: hypothetical protein HKP09_04430, partial [Enterobacterales bacterium]|nr:hypothetical protein [Enterobacterales bacterium]